MRSSCRQARGAHLRRSGCALAALVAVCSLLSPLSIQESARAQTLVAGEIELVHQPLFHKPSDKLGIRVRVSNRSIEAIEGFQIQTSVYSRVQNRITLHETFDGLEDEGAIGAQPTAFDATIEPGESMVVTIDHPLTLFPSVADEGVYPLTISLYEAGLTEILDQFTTELIFYPDEVDRPLNMSLVVPIAPQAARGPSGAFEPDETQNFPLETSLSDTGWLSGLLRGLQKGVDAGLRVGLAPSPRFSEELAGMSDGYVRRIGEEVETIEEGAPTASSAAAAYERLEGLLERRSVQPLLSPYSSPDLPTLYDTFGVAHLIEQLEAGGETLQQVFPQVSFDERWLFAAGSRWDAETLDQVEGLRPGLSTFVGAPFFEDPIDETVAGCPSIELEPVQGSFTCPVTIETDSAEVPAYVHDPDVQSRFTALATDGPEMLDLHRFFAETAFIHLERPVEPRRIIHGTVPSRWEPSPRVSSRLFRGLARAPWLDTWTPREGFRHAARPRDRALVEDLPELTEDPGREYFSAIENAEKSLEVFEELGPPDQRRQRLHENLLVAESRSWWSTDAQVAQGLDFARATEQEIRDEFDKISVTGPNTTLTSKRSAIEVNVFNETTYPVTVDIAFESSDPGAIRIDESDAYELQGVQVEPGGAPAINVDAIAETSGLYLVKASVLSPDTGEEINHENISIRSTNFNQIALALTFGALAFLILFYVLRVIKRRRHSPEVPAESTTT
ncbi:MAG: DUF6049 family protein [Actinomycetota bacterium]|nr:DUF6049 family protein [Actinomycetota bacterium]